MNMRLLFTDTETGGTNPIEDALLDVALVVWEDGVELARKSWKIQSAGKYVYSSATEINGIELKKHDKTAMKPEQAAGEIVAFIRKWFPDDRAILVGHNVSFDRDFLKTLILEYTLETFESLVSHRLLDTMSILNFLVANHKLPTDVLSSDGAFKHFGIVVENRHTAMGDVDATIVLFDHLSEFIQP